MVGLLTRKDQMLAFAHKGAELFIQEGLVAQTGLVGASGKRCVTLVHSPWGSGGQGRHTVFSQVIKVASGFVRQGADSIGQVDEGTAMIHQGRPPMFTQKQGIVSGALACDKIQWPHAGGVPQQEGGALEDRSSREQGGL